MLLKKTLTTTSLPTKIIFSLLLLFSFISNAIADNVGFSGMTYMGDNRYLVVMDTKNHKSGARLGIYTVNTDNTPDFIPLTIDDWQHPEGQASDLESTCKIPNSSNEYLISESGDWKGKFGRIFRLKIDQFNARVTAVYSLPIFHSNNEQTQGSNYEGMLCIENRDKLHILMGERGGSDINPNGFLTLGVLSPDASEINWIPLSVFKYAATSKGLLSALMPTRSISDLYLDEANVIWASTTQDDGDMGPFNSVIYALGKVHFEEQQMTIEPVRKDHWAVSGLKIEALASAPESFKNALLSYGSEDEDLGGVWRVLR